MKEKSSKKISLDVSKLSAKERAKLFATEAPEFKGVMADFDTRMEEAEKKLWPVVNLINEGRIPSGPAADFVKAKYQIILK